MNEIGAVFLLAELFGTFICGGTTSMVADVVKYGKPLDHRIEFSAVDPSFATAGQLYWMVDEEKKIARVTTTHYQGEHMGCRITTQEYSFADQ